MLRKYLIGIVSALSLAACQTTGGGGGGGGGGTGTYAASALNFIDPSQTAGTYTADAGNLNINANLTFRASTAFLNGANYAKVGGHEMVTTFSKAETGTGGVAATYTKGAGSFSGILTSLAASSTFTDSVVTFSAQQLSTLNTLRTDIVTLANDIANLPGHANINIWKASLNTKLGELADLVTYGDLQLTFDSMASGNGYYGTFANEENGEFTQISGIYARADGVNVANYTALINTAAANYAAKFKGVGVVNGLLVYLKDDNGTVAADFVAQTLTGAFAVANTENTETGNIAFNGAMSLNAGGVTGLVFNNNAATYVSTAGQLGNFTGGSAEATLLNGGDSILGSVNFVNGDKALVGGFGGDK